MAYLESTIHRYQSVLFSSHNKVRADFAEEENDLLKYQRQTLLSAISKKPGEGFSSSLKTEG
jgi:hypothetical protein